MRKGRRGRGGREARGAYLTWHTGRVSRHILIEFFSRSGNAGISRRYYYIFRRYVARARSLSLSVFVPLSLSLFSPRRDNTLRDVFSCRRGAAGRTYLAHYTCATLYPLSLSLSVLSDLEGSQFCAISCISRHTVPVVSDIVPSARPPPPTRTRNNPTRSTSTGPGFPAGFQSILVPSL